uniref:RRM domain-containing protein n=1 Tax=Parascaris univalens TaxID=6257 RepID=A0A915AY28_PARUN
MKSDAVEENQSEEQSTAVVDDTSDAKADDFDGYVSVAGSEGEGASVLEVPVDEDGGLRLATLEHSFPNAVGLKFKNETNGVYRTLAVNDESRTILQPKGGWGTRRYVAIFRPEAPPVKALKRPACPEEAISEKRNALDESQSGERHLRAPVDLVVLNIDFGTTKDSLVKYFEKFGKVEFAEIKTERATGKSKGYGFIKMSTLEEQQKVLETGHFIDGRVVEVRIPLRTCDPDAKKARPDLLSTKIYVGRVPDEFTVQDLFKYFSEKVREMSPHARVDRVIIPTPRRGFAFITFNDANVTKRFIEMQDVVIGGVSMAISYPAPRKETDDFDMNANDYYSGGFTPGMPGAYHSFPSDSYGGGHGSALNMLSPMGAPPRPYGYHPQSGIGMPPYASRAPNNYGMRARAPGGMYPTGGRMQSGYGARPSGAARSQGSYGQPPKGLGNLDY